MNGGVNLAGSLAAKRTAKRGVARYGLIGGFVELLRGRAGDG